MAREGQEIAGNYVDRPGWLQVAFYVHVCLGGLAMLTAPVQLSSRVRRRAPRLHRVAGRVGIASILVRGDRRCGPVAVLGRPGVVGFAGFGLLAVAWGSQCALASYRTIRRGDVAAHRRWAIRTFALTYRGRHLRLWLGGRDDGACEAGASSAGGLRGVRPRLRSGVPHRPVPGVGPESRSAPWFDHGRRDDVLAVPTASTAALDRAFDATDGLDVRLGGGASAVQQYLRAGLVDELHLVIVPVLLGGGERLFTDGRGDAAHVRLARNDG
ncbi:MAG: DUF2306 domain-containing protein [Microthrixaceae bacterium]